MSPLAIFVLVYGFGWMAMSVKFCASLRRDLQDPAPEIRKYLAAYPRIGPVVVVAVFLIVAVAAGSIWWMILLAKLAVFVWHHLGHPGADK